VNAIVSRADVVDMLASYGNRPASAVGERIDSLELAWLVHQVEQRYGAALDLSDDEVSLMSTVDAALTVLRRAMRADTRDGAA
jgi:acyl carrier protein